MRNLPSKVLVLLLRCHVCFSRTWGLKDYLGSSSSCITYYTLPSCRCIALARMEKKTFSPVHFISANVQHGMHTYTHTHCSFTNLSSCPQAGLFGPDMCQKREPNAVLEPLVVSPTKHTAACCASQCSVASMSTSHSAWRISNVKPCECYPGKHQTVPSNQ